jgi:hypothetical protein
VGAACSLSRCYPDITETISAVRAGISRVPASSQPTGSVSRGVVEAALGAIFVFMGVIHLLPATSSALQEHYRKHWGDQGGRYQLFVGVAFLLLGINSLAAAAGLPHLEFP